MNFYKGKCKFYLSASCIFKHFTDNSKNKIQETEREKDWLVFEGGEDLANVVVVGNATIAVGLTNNSEVCIGWMVARQILSLFLHCVLRRKGHEHM